MKRLWGGSVRVQLWKKYVWQRTGPQSRTANAHLWWCEQVGSSCSSEARPGKVRKQNLLDLEGQVQEFTHSSASNIWTNFSVVKNLRALQKQTLTFMLTRLVVRLDWGWLHQAGLRASSSGSGVLHLSSFSGSAWRRSGYLGHAFLMTHYRHTKPQGDTCDDS